MNKIKRFLSDFISKWIATWTFVIIYTSAMVLWIILHNYKILDIDSKDFIRYNLFLSWAAGIQASIVLMATNRQTEKDRLSILKGIDLDNEIILKLTNMKKILNRISDLNTKINNIEEIITQMESEENEK